MVVPRKDRGEGYWLVSFKQKQDVKIDLLDSGKQLRPGELLKVAPRGAFFDSRPNKKNTNFGVQFRAQFGTKDGSLFFRSYCNLLKSDKRSPKNGSIFGTRFWDTFWHNFCIF